MNFLAHLYLSGDNEDWLLGNFVADFIRNKEVENYPPEVQQGIALHRLIDQYTDNHPIVRQGTHRLQPHHRKYAPVVIDILYDHLLCKNWDQYSSQSLQDFASKAYKILESRIDEMPVRLQKRLLPMIADNWLVKYGSEEGMRYTFYRMDLRTSFPSNFAKAYDHLMEDFDTYNKEFNQFFPEVIEYVSSLSLEV